MVARAAISGSRNKLTSHPQASSLKDRSCHRATNVKTSRVAAATFLDPPTGMYKYLVSAPSLQADPPDDPEVIAPVPRSPKPKYRVIVENTSNHVLGRVHPIQQSP
jgi:hypothetical protein